MKNDGLRKYFDYMKSIGLKPEAMRTSSKQYVFIDHSVSGRSIRLFEDLLRSRKSDYSHLTNMSFCSIENILKSYKPTSEAEASFIGEFLKTNIHDRLVKDYSPIFKLPVERIGQVKEIRQRTPANLQLNQLKFLIACENYLS